MPKGQRAEGRMDKSKIVNIAKVIPKFYAQVCPVCNGFGTLRHGTKTCQGCEGHGYIIVPTGQTEGLNHEQLNT